MSYGSESFPKEHKKTELYSSTHEHLPRISIVSEARGSKATNAVEMHNSECVYAAIYTYLINGAVACGTCRTAEDSRRILSFFNVEDRKPYSV